MMGVSLQMYDSGAGDQRSGGNGSDPTLEQQPAETRGTAAGG